MNRWESEYVCMSWTTNFSLTLGRKLNIFLVIGYALRLVWDEMGKGMYSGICANKFPTHLKAHPMVKSVKFSTKLNVYFVVQL